ncbi:MAG: hypothetical protein OEQ29_14055 [Alphaproteobacteria bacterium]|nr:hypothetical protein [Alphaproteobacteria bacterium]
MTANASAATVREAVAVFDDVETLQAAIDTLLSSGFDRADLSLLASEPVVAEKLGHKYKKVSELEDDARVPRSAYVSTESIGDAQGGLIGGLAYVGAVAAAGAIVASGGTVAAAFAAAALAGGAGGMFGSTLAKWIGDRHADALQAQIDHGGLLLWVRTWNADREARASDILASHSAHDVHIHDLPAAGG